ncbi:hypothetical protein QMG83_00585 [Salinibacterium sp. G-O1]|uniref:hypothetical protein n=1 Tax=Salinibacterium sp. G-O1 TaxID=3046208 RepID=UPI0024BA9B3A|nr:hypothetical protein [Salinibacterium sp. G-O1]MDJ0333711.1 hypothetical protein [Salinibacterium sp. G-O1]
MGDDLVISGGGSFAIGTDELFACAERVLELAREISALDRDLASIDSSLSRRQLESTGAAASGIRAEADIDRAMVTLAEVEVQARALHFGMGAAAQGYGFAEHFVGSMIHEFTGQWAALLARFSPMLLLATLGGTAVLGVAGGQLAGATPRGGTTAPPPGAPRSGGPGVPRPSNWMRQNNEIITNPLTVDLVRIASQSSGDVVAGAAGVPPQLLGLLGGAGVAIGSKAMMGAGSLVGILAETPVRLVDSHTTAVGASPSGFAERLGRVPDTEATDGAQVVIEKYSTPGEPDRFEVYVAGTVTFSPMADSEPWDMTSNMANAAGVTGGSYASVAAAMQLAGIDASSPVQFTGYSQGGGTAARLAASGDYNTQGLATFGGPTGQVRLPEGFPAVIVEHADDVVPALGGEQVNTHALLVEREVFAGRDVPTDYAVPAHHYEYYEQTARLMDKAESEAITGASGSLDAFGRGASTITSTTYRFERVPER